MTDPKPTAPDEAETPADEYDCPNDVLESDLSRAEKTNILVRWRAHSLAEAIASGPTLSGDGERLLGEIIDGLRHLRAPER